MQILYCIDRYLEARTGHVKKLKPPRTGFRLRCGDFRVFFDPSGDNGIEITAVRNGILNGFSPPESALLRMADALADTPSNVSDELYAELRRHFSEDQLIELAASAAQENFRARYNRVFDVGSDGLYRKGLQFKQR